MLKTITNKVFALIRPHLGRLTIGDTYSLTRTINNSFQTKTKLNGTANSSQTLYQPQTARIKGPSAN